jgi:hypothetical protein
MDHLFLPDAPVVIDLRAGDPLRLVGGGEVGAFIDRAIQQFDFFEFVILNAHIVFPDGPGAGSAVGRMFMCEIRHEQSTGRVSQAFGIYHDRYSHDARGWRFAERRYHSLARLSGDLEVFPFPGHPGIEVAGARGHSGGVSPADS